MILLKGEKVLGETNNNNFIMQPKVDYCFKELMKDLDVLKGFLSAVLDIDVKEITSVELLPTELSKLSKEDFIYQKTQGMICIQIN